MNPNFGYSLGDGFVQTTVIPNQGIFTVDPMATFGQVPQVVGFTQPVYPGMVQALPTRKISSGTLRKRAKKMQKGKWKVSDEEKFQKKYFR